MPLQNRVTPFGGIVATPERGMFTGNRGIIHDPATRSLLTRRWSSKAWIVCACEYKGIRRKVMSRRSWTELFVLDEATALSAGHRPCFLCRRTAANAFREAWAIGNRIAAPAASEMDAVLHRERLAGKHKRLHPMPPSLPDGAMLASGDEAFLIVGGKPWRWSFSGYTLAQREHFDALLTPPSTLAALAAGYRLELHHTVSSQSRSSLREAGEGDRR
jgi:hypothetical protein